jgi:hypothetical protein
MAPAYIDDGTRLMLAVVIWVFVLLALAGREGR